MSINLSPSIFGRCEKLLHSGLSVYSHNILLPNSLDGWWVYKMYSSRHKLEMFQTSWEFRKELIKADVISASSDIVCFQEVCADSFENDFSFMKEIGYDMNVLYKKGRFRPATFWRSSCVSSFGPSIHRDRCLIQAFSAVGDSSKKNKNCLDTDIPNEIIWVSNVHLSAGSHLGQGARRFRQIYDCTDTIRKEQSKITTLIHKSYNKNNKNNKINTSSEIHQSDDLTFGVVIVGDMNIDGNFERLSRGEATGALDMYLTQGKLPENFREDGEEINSKEKLNKLCLFQDAYEEAYKASRPPLLPPPPSMVLEKLYDVITEPESIESTDETVAREAGKHKLSKLAKLHLREIFTELASTQITDENTGVVETVMGPLDVEKWLLLINLKIGRGSEFRSAVKYMKSSNEGTSSKQTNNNVSFQEKEEEEDKSEVLEEEPAISDEISKEIPSSGYLTLASFINIYENEINLGKVWGVAFDLSACGHPISYSDDLFTARFDRFYFGGSTYSPREKKDPSYDADHASISCRNSRLIAVRDTGGRQLVEFSNPIPNLQHPSDHLPIMGVISWK